MDIDKILSAISTARCCIARKQCEQIEREANLMERDLQTDSDINFLLSAIYQLKNFVNNGGYNQIDYLEAWRLMERINAMCECINVNYVYDLQNYPNCLPAPICVQAIGDEIFAPVTVYNNSMCVYPINIVILGVPTDIFVLQSVSGGYQLINYVNGDILATNSSIAGTYKLYYNVMGVETLEITLGACS